MPAGDVWGNSWGDSWNGYWTDASVAPVVEEVIQPTGGWYPYRKDEDEKRRERIAMGIIPSDMPEQSQAKIRAAASIPVRVLAERKLVELADELDEAEALRGTLVALLDAYEQDRQARLRDLIGEMEQRREAITVDLLSAEQMQRNTSAALIMLSLMEI